MGSSVSGEDTDITGLLGEKGVLGALFSIGRDLLDDAEILVARNALKSKIEKRILDRELERKRDQQKQEKPNTDKTQDLAVHAMLIDIAHTIEANNERLRVLERQQQALGKHLALLVAGEPIELNEDGTLKDADAEAAVQEYEKAKNTTVDRMDPIQIQAVHDYGKEQVTSTKNTNGELTQQFVDSGGDLLTLSNEVALVNSHSQVYPSAPAGPPADAPKP